MPIQFNYKNDSSGRRTKDLESIYYTQDDAFSKIRLLENSIKIVEYYLVSDNPLFSVSGIVNFSEGENNSYMISRVGMNIFIRNITSVTEIIGERSLIINVRDGGYFKIYY